MQPTSPLPPLLAFDAPTGEAAAPATASTASQQRVEERPQSPLAQGSYAWPDWAVIAFALVCALAASAWWAWVQKTHAARTSTLADRHGGRRA